MTDQPVEAPKTSGAGTDETVRVAALAQRTFERLRVENTRYLPESITVDTSWELITNEMRALRVELTGYVLADKIAEDSYTRTRETPFPSSPWQFFKERHKKSWWLGWIVRRRPVTYEKHRFSVTVHVDRYLSYPEAEIPVGFGSPVVTEVARVETQDPMRYVVDAEQNDA